MTPEPADLRALVFGDDEFTDICEEVPTVLEHSERLIETLNFNVVDATVNRRDHLITFQGVLSVNDETVQFSEDGSELALAHAKPMSGEQLDHWRKRRGREAWPMPPAAD